MSIALDMDRFVISHTTAKESVIHDTLNASFYHTFKQQSLERSRCSIIATAPHSNN